MDFRQYDNAIGRFSVIDPLTEEDFGNSPYAFAGNNPVLYSDPSGLKFMAPETMGNTIIPSGGVFSMLMHGMTGPEITAALEQQAWGPDFQIRSGGGGGVDFNPNGGHWERTMDVNWHVSDESIKTILQKIEDGDKIYENTLPELICERRWVNTWVADGNGSSGFDLANVVTGMDAFGVAMTKANMINKLTTDSFIAVKGFKAFTRSGTVIGAIAGGGPAIYSMWKNYHEGKSQDWRDYASLGLAGLGIASEFFGIGELWDGTVGVGIAAGSLSYDVWDMSHPKKE